MSMRCKNSFHFDFPFVVRHCTAKGKALNAEMSVYLFNVEGTVSQSESSRIIWVINVSRLSAKRIQHLIEIVWVVLENCGHAIVLPYFVFHLEPLCVFKLIALPIYNVTVSLLVDRIILILCFYISLQLKGNSKPYILEDGLHCVCVSKYSFWV